MNYIIEKKETGSVITPQDILLPENTHVIPVGKPVSIFRFSGTPDSSKIAEKTTAIIYKRLLAERGEDNIFLSSFANKKGYLVTGSVEKNKTGYLITMKIVDPSRGVIINMETAEISSEDELPAVCNRMAKTISRSTR